MEIEETSISQWSEQALYIVAAGSVPTRVWNDRGGLTRHIICRAGTNAWVYGGDRKLGHFTWDWLADGQKGHGCEGEERVRNA